MGTTHEAIFEEAYNFHGHVCLMSTAGIRIARAAMDAIGLSKGDCYLFAFYHAQTCAADPIQFITGCTLGNNNIIIDDEKKSHTLELVRQSDGTGVSVTLKDDILKRMKNCMVKKKEAKRARDPKLIEKSAAEFIGLLDMLRNEDATEIVEVSPFSIDIKPFLRF